MDAVIKGLVTRLPVVEVAWLRYLVGSAAMLLIVAVARPGWPSGETLRANALRAVLVVITATSFFYALGQLPLAETLVLSFISPVVTAVFAALILGEKLHRRILLALGAGFGGVLLIAAAGIGEHGGAAGRSGSISGVVAVLISAVGYSASNVLLRARAQRDPLLTIVAIQNMAPCLMLAGPAAYAWTAPSVDDSWLLAAVGLLGVAGHLCLARAYARAEATRLAPLDYTALIWAIGIGYFAFGEVPTLWTGLGAAFILGAAWIASRR
jgi:S-adenosylmethionine uptake transporter